MVMAIQMGHTAHTYWQGLTLRWTSHEAGDVTTRCCWNLHLPNQWGVQKEWESATDALFAEIEKRRQQWGEGHTWSISGDWNLNLVSADVKVDDIRLTTLLGKLAARHMAWTADPAGASIAEETQHTHRTHAYYGLDGAHGGKLEYTGQAGDYNI